ncbi:hypothetical protein ACHAWF_006202 [Thalassiosira exigua]
MPNKRILPAFKRIKSEPNRKTHNLQTEQDSSKCTKAQQKEPVSHLASFAFNRARSKAHEAGRKQRGKNLPRDQGRGDGPTFRRRAAFARILQAIASRRSAQHGEKQSIRASSRGSNAVAPLPGSFCLARRLLPAAAHRETP